MISIRDIDHVVLRVVDVDAMLGFYCGVLGCTLDRRRDDLGLVQLRAGRAMIDLVVLNLYFAKRLMHDLRHTPYPAAPLTLRK